MKAGSFKFGTHMCLMYNKHVRKTILWNCVSSCGYTLEKCNFQNSTFSIPLSQKMNKYKPGVFRLGRLNI